MKIRGSIVCFIVVTAAVIALLLWYGKKRAGETPLAVSTPTNAASSVMNAASQPMTAQIRTNASATKMVKGANLSKLPPMSKEEQMLKGLATLNDVPIVFYGKIEDQFSNAVPNATVNFGVRIYNGYESTVKYGQVISDVNGLFTISGYKGESLGIGVKKLGYAWVSMEGSGIYSYMWPENQRAHPYQNNPTVIKMWKLQGAEPLVSIDQHYKLHYTGAPINFDLLTGKIVPAGGDIKLTVTRSPGVISGRNRLDWSVQVEAVDGGLMDSGGQERVTYAAPESGYQPNMNFIFSTNAPYKWFGGFNQGFFMTSRNGQVYSKVGLSFDINDAPDEFMSVTFSGIASTNGSRNWEATAPQ